MKIGAGNANKAIRIDKRFSVIIIVTLVIFMISGSTMTMSYAAPQTLPSCTDPTGQNLRCMMVISTLPPPPNALHCQETSGQILPCSYTTQNLSNGEQIVAITVYVPANYIFSSPTVIKVVVHKTSTKTTSKTKVVFVTPCSSTQKWNPILHRCVDITPPQCIGPHIIGVLATCPQILPPPPPPGYTCESKYYTGPCPPTDENAYTKCLSAALLADDTKGELACARLLPDTPQNVYTKCLSEALIKDDLRAELACAKYLPNTSGAAHNLTNTRAPQLTNTSIPAPSVAKPSGPTCVAGNCTSGTPPPVDCTKNPNDPSCVTPPATPTQTCPDGSVISATGQCPTPPTTSNNPAPSNNPTPPPSNTPPSDNGQSGTGNNNPPPSPDNSNPPPSNNPPSSSNGGNGGNGRNG